MQNALSISEDFKLVFLLHQARHATYRFLDKDASQFGITLLQAVVLVMIENSSAPVTPAELSRQMFRRHNTVAALVRRMENKGLVILHKDLHKKNMIRVEITEKGRQIYSKLIIGDAPHELMSCLSEEEREQLRSCLKRLRNRAFELLRPGFKPISI